MQVINGADLVISLILVMEMAHTSILINFLKTIINNKNNKLSHYLKIQMFLKYK